MISEYAILEKLILLEAVLVLFIVILTYALKVYFNRKRKHLTELTLEVNEYLKQSSTKDFAEEWRRVDILLPIVNALTSHRMSVKPEFIHNVLLPLARKKFTSKHWLDRLFAAKTFELEMMEEDKKRVNTLLADKVPLVNIHATLAALEHDDESALPDIIKNMQKRRRLTQSIYLQLFQNARPESRAFVQRYLGQEQDPFARATCYKILLNYPVDDFLGNIQADLRADNIELRLAALRYFTYSQKSEAIPQLIDFLSDDSWEIRAISANLLGELKAKQAIPHLAKTLCDKAWWVRMNSAQALKKLGEEGIAVLNHQDPEKDLFAYETAMHVLYQMPHPDRE